MATQRAGEYPALQSWRKLLSLIVTTTEICGHGDGDVSSVPKAKDVSMPTTPTVNLALGRTQHLIDALNVGVPVGAILGVVHQSISPK